jgi:hypothetical protein
MGRKFTNQILDDIANGFLDEEEVLRACLRYMSEDEVYDMAVRNDFIIEDKDVYDDFEDDNEDDLSYEQRILKRHESF